MGLVLDSEDSLLLACADMKEGNGRRETLRRLARECKDWDYILKAMRYHGITALVSSHLDEAASDIVPCEPLKEIRRRFRTNVARNFFLVQELLSLMRKFSVRGIDVIPIKGPFLAITAYGNLAMREFRDLDVMVQKQDLNQASQLLKECGYEQPAAQTDGLEPEHIESQLGCDFLRKDGKISVELHWSFIQKWLGFEVDLDALWNAPERINVGGANVRRLPAELALLYLCAHGTKHRWNRLFRVVDVAQQLRAQPVMDWDQLLKTAKRTGSLRILFLGLHLVHGLLGVEFPQKVWTQMKDDVTAEALAREISAVLFSSATQTVPKRPALTMEWFYFRSKERWKDRLRYLRYSTGWLFLPSQKDRQWISLPAGLGWLYFFLRPIRAACAIVRPYSGETQGPPPR